MHNYRTMITTKQGFKVVGILPFKFGKQKTISEKAIENIEFNNMQNELKQEYKNNKVLFDRDVENNRIIFFIC